MFNNLGIVELIVFIALLVGATIGRQLGVKASRWTWGAAAVFLLSALVTPADLVSTTITFGVAVVAMTFGALNANRTTNLV